MKTNSNLSAQLTKILTEQIFFVSLLKEITACLVNSKHITERDREIILIKKSASGLSYENVGKKFNPQLSAGIIRNSIKKTERKIFSFFVLHRSYFKEIQDLKKQLKDKDNENANLLIEVSKFQKVEIAQEKKKEEENLALEKLRATSLRDFDLSVDVIDAFDSIECKTLGEAIDWRKEKKWNKNTSGIRNFGAKGIKEIDLLIKLKAPSLYAGKW